MSIRKTVYIRDRDRDIISYVNKVITGDLSMEFRELIRDGIKWRNSGDAIGKATTPSTNNSTKKTPDFSDIALGKKEVSRDDMDKKFNRL